MELNETIKAFLEELFELLDEIEAVLDQTDGDLPKEIQDEYKQRLSAWDEAFRPVIESLSQNSGNFGYQDVISFRIPKSTQELINAYLKKVGIRIRNFSKYLE